MRKSYAEAIPLMIPAAVNVITLGVPVNETWKVMELRGNSSMCAETTATVMVNGDELWKIGLAPGNAPLVLNQPVGKGAQLIVRIDKIGITHEVCNVTLVIEVERG